MRPDPAFSYVRDLIERLTGVRPEPDADGDLPLALGGAGFYIRVRGERAVVQVFSVVLADVAPDADLMVVLNDINMELMFARVFHVADQVLMEVEIWADDVNPTNLRLACENIASATDYFGHRLHEVFGGTMRFEESKTSAYETPERLGLYL